MGVWKGVWWDINMLEVCLVGNWVCAQDRQWWFPAKFLRWILVGRYSVFFVGNYQTNSGSAI